MDPIQKIGFLTLSILLLTCSAQPAGSCDRGGRRKCEFGYFCCPWESNNPTGQSGWCIPDGKPCDMLEPTTTEGASSAQPGSSAPVAGSAQPADASPAAPAPEAAKSKKR